MSQLRTITRASNWTPERLRVLSAVVISAEHVSDAPLGRVEGVVLDERGAVQSFIVKLWEDGQATRAVLVPLARVKWYTEGFAPALGISWTGEMLRGQPALTPSGRPHRPSLGVPSPVAATPDGEDRTAHRRARHALGGALVGIGVAAALGALFEDPLLAVALALVFVPFAALGARSRQGAPMAARSPADPGRAPWVAHLERSLDSVAHFERRVLHFSMLRSARSPRPASLPAAPAVAHAIAFRKTADEPRRPIVRANARASQGG